MATCPQCSYAHLAEDARFCSNCGARIEIAPPPAAESPQNLVQVEMKVEQIAGEGRAVGADIGEVDGDLTVVQGNLIHIHNPSAELLKSLQAVQAVPTQMQPKTETAEPADRQRLAAVENNVARLLEQMDQAEKEGRPVEQIQAGQVQLSRVDLLIKQGVLLKSEVEAELLQLAAQRLKARGDLASQPQARVDLEELMAGMDTAGYERKLQQAYDHFVEASRLDPGNIEALLHQAQAASELNHEGETEKILYQVINLIGRPTDDRQRFWLAQARYMLAVSGDTPNIALLQEARQMFAALGEVSWVQQCDLIINPPAAMAAYLNRQVGFSQAPEAGTVQSGTPQYGTPPTGGQDAGLPVTFSPVGKWQVQVSSGVQIQLQYDLLGGCQAYFSPGLNRPTSYFQGRWGYDPANQVLQHQGLVDGWSPYNFWLQIVQYNPVAIMAVAPGGFTFMYQRTG